MKKYIVDFSNTTPKYRALVQESLFELGYKWGRGINRYRIEEGLEGGIYTDCLGNMYVLDYFSEYFVRKYDTEKACLQKFNNLLARKEEEISSPRGSLLDNFSLELRSIRSLENVVEYINKSSLENIDDILKIKVEDLILLIREEGCIE